MKRTRDAECILTGPQISFRRLVKTNAPALAQLLDDLDAGITPGWMEIWTAISQGVDYLTAEDSLTGCQLEPGERPPGTYCLTC